MNTTLIIMAAGIGSRFGGGIKQLAKMGPNGEIIMDYSIRDAKEAGFNKVVFIIRKDIFEEFEEVIGNRIKEQIDVEYVFQELDDLPEGFEVPAGRKFISEFPASLKKFLTSGISFFFILISISIYTLFFSNFPVQIASCNNSLCFYSFRLII